MLIWGSGGDVVQLGNAGEAHCQICEKDRPFKNILSYRYAHLWYLFSWVTEKTYATVCDVCGRGTRHDSKQFEEKLGKSPIPFYRRFGGLFLLGLIAVAVVFGIVASNQSNARETKLIAQPQVGDLYVVDLEKLVPGGFDGHAYGVMRVASINGQQISLQVPNMGYSKLTGASRDLSSKARDESYYVAEQIQLPISQLQQLHDSGEIHDVSRN